ncbi:integral membrane sensor signal transduction histidine kinase [Methylocella silvestris BL2]|uniref:histidine kinase n=1 Tax=Methylocella silvestris (strain DSM 15510 / CIP 108128 / LMG 27833 / NCIMB 13906 / BL2) TaxID=395965 RepID=B8EIE1_METSB|nr:HAMP domain-containing sensor histidine kinase [Methylocella silvestris]ACK51260.1 integral membrane sensor signal transduction histidine kinase [Methylocella silvestris BL2]
MSELAIPPNVGHESLAAEPAARTARAGRRRKLRFGLSMRVLVLNTAFVMIAATMIYVPAISIYRSYWLHNRLSAAYTAALVLEAAPSAMTPPELSRQLLDSVGARVIVLNMKGTKRILASSDLPPAVDAVYDLRTQSLGDVPLEAIETLFAPSGRVITVLGAAPMGGDAVAITMDEAPLKRGMEAYSRRLLIMTLVMSAIVAILATIAINIMVLRPVRRLTDNITEFGADPENAARIIEPSGSEHEIGQAEAALAVMQESLVRELNQKKHLAALGLAVAKINHDMRNMLSSAQLLSDRLANVTDPLAQRIAPKLVATLDRAIRFCQATMTYGRAVDEPPKPRRFLLRPLVEEAIESVGPLAAGHIEFVNDAPERLEVCADPEQMFRVLVNLLRNGVEALQSAGSAPGWPAEIRIAARERLGPYDGRPAGGPAAKGATGAPAGRAETIIEVSDSGPGVPDSARAKLFAAFFTADRAGGTGLGLVIASDLVRAHGGSLTLAPPATASAAEPPGAKFIITLPLHPAASEATASSRFENAPL